MRKSSRPSDLPIDPKLPALDAPGRARRFPKIRLNAKAALILGVLLVIALVGYFVGIKIQDRNVRSQALAQAKDFEKAKNIDQSFRHLQRYLATHPGDIEALENLARLSASSVRSMEEVNNAIKYNDQLLRLDPEGKDRQETRRRLINLYVLAGNAHRSSTIAKLMPEQASFELRFRAADTIARDLIRRGEQAGTVEPRDHQLKGLALEGLAVPGDDKALQDSIAEFVKALQGDPADVVAAEHLAQLYQDRLNNPKEAERVLDKLLEAAPKLPIVRLVRNRYYDRIHRSDLATIELLKATELAPEDLSVQLTTIYQSIRTGDIQGARKRLSSLPEDQVEAYKLQIQVMKGLIEFSEEHPEDAINSWRQGLLRIGGTDAELTWWLAHALLEMGRVAEARPLVTQYRRLAGEENLPLYRFLEAELDERTGRPARAVVSLEWAKDRIADNWQAMLQMALGRCYEALWDEPKALAAYRRAIQIDPRLAEPRLAAARLLNRKPAEAIVEIERGLAQVPDDPQLRISLATSRLRQQQAIRNPSQRDWTEFDRALASALEIAPKNGALLLMRADRLSMSGNLAMASKLLSEATAETPKNPALWTAWSEALARSGKLAEALDVLNQASKPSATGDRAVIRIARARLLILQNQGREAREQLIRDDKHLSLGDRPLVWATLGQIETIRGDYKAAQAALSECAKLLPDDPRPRLAMLELAQAQGNDESIHSTVEQLRDLGGKDDVAWRLCHAQELLWSVPPEIVKRRDARLEKAYGLVSAVLVDAPELPAAHLIQGQILERLPEKETEAIASYQRAFDRGSEAAMPRLVSLLTRMGQFDRLAELKLKVPSTRLDQVTAQASLQVGDLEAAARTAGEAAKNADAPPGIKLWEAWILETAGKFDQADSALRAAAEESGNDAEPWVALIRSLANHGKKAELTATIDRARKLIKTSNPDLLEGRLLWASNDLKAADLVFEKAIKDKPDDPTVFLAVARYYEGTGRIAEAKSSFQRVLETNPKNRVAARQLALLLSLDPATWDQAATLVDLDGSPGDDPEDRMARGVILARSVDNARRSRAVEILESLVGDLPVNNPVAKSSRNVLVRLLLDLDRPERAAEVAMTSAIAGIDFNAMLLHVETLIRVGKLLEAGRELERLTPLNPSDSNLASLKVRWIRESAPQGKAADAIEQAVKDLGEGPTALPMIRAAFTTLDEMGPNATASAERVGRLAASRQSSSSWMPAKILARRGKGAEAIALCQDSIRSNLREDRRGTASVAAEIINASGADKDLMARVEEILETLLKRDPDDTYLFVPMAMLRHSQGRFEDEVKLYQAVMVQRPNEPTVLNNLAWSLSEGVNRPSEGLNIINQLVARVGQNPGVLDTRGVILVRLGKLGEAIRDLEESSRLAPAPPTFYHLALAYQKKGQVQEYRRCRDIAIQRKLDPSMVDLTERADLAAFLRP